MRLSFNSEATEWSYRDELHNRRNAVSLNLSTENIRSEIFLT